MKKRMLAALMALTMLMTLLPTVAFANEPVSSQTWTGTIEGYEIDGGSEGAPLVITVTGTVLINGDTSQCSPDLYLHGQLCRG